MTMLRILFFTLTVNVLVAQPAFDYELMLRPIAIPGLSGLHSYAYAQHDGLWLLIGGRKDGIHARQPFNAFPAAANNNEMIVVDPVQQLVWSSPLSQLSQGISEQFQSTNMSFYQSADTLYLMGGYAFSPAAGGHITFPNLSAIIVSQTIQAIINATSPAPYIRQIRHDIFANTGGQLGKIKDVFYLVGGQRFDGRYNPMGPDHGPGFSQTYHTTIQKFRLHNHSDTLYFSDYQSINDPVHLRRRDYNLLPQVFPDGQEGYMISSGVFQLQADLPFLYPVNITENGYEPVTAFNQYLSHYHSAKAALYDSLNNRMHNIFFGGISQYYYQDGQLVQDNLVPFVRTISMITRFDDGSLQEYQLPVEMPGLKGAGAEFIPNRNLPHFPSEVIKLDGITADTFSIGHIFGGIQTTQRNPFQSNQTSSTSADNALLEVVLIRRNLTGLQEINGENPFNFEVFPNPASEMARLRYQLPYAGQVYYMVSTMDGKIVQRGRWALQNEGEHEQVLTLNSGFSGQPMMVTLVFDNKYYVVKKLLVR
jgi:hypothetical protein